MIMISVSAVFKTQCSACLESKSYLKETSWHVCMFSIYSSTAGKFTKQSKLPLKTPFQLCRSSNTGLYLDQHVLIVLPVKNNRNG